MKKIDNLKDLRTWTGTLAAGLILIIDNNGQLTYEAVDTWNITHQKPIDIKILHGPYKQEILENMALKMLNQTHNNYLKIIFYNCEKIYLKELFKFEDSVTIFKD